MARSRLVTGAMVLVYINNQMFGRCADLSWGADTPQKELHTVDMLPPAELIPGPVSVRGSMQIYKLHKDGGIEAAGLAATWADITRQKYFSIVVLDRVTDTVVFRADKCATTSQNWRNGRGHIMGTIGFSGLFWGNETQPSAT